MKKGVVAGFVFVAIIAIVINKVDDRMTETQKYLANLCIAGMVVDLAFLYRWAGQKK